jgi:hypothetical protein
LKEIEKSPFLPEAVAGVGFAPEIVFEKQGFGTAIDTPNAVVAPTGQGHEARGSGLSYLREE